MVFDNFYKGIIAKSNYLLTATLIAGLSWAYHLGSFTPNFTPNFKTNKELEEVVRVEEIDGSLWNISLKDLIQYSPAQRDSAIDSFLELAAERDSLTGLEIYPSKEVKYEEAENKEATKRVLAPLLVSTSLLGLGLKYINKKPNKLSKLRHREI